jgi:hypothetical protein
MLGKHSATELPPSLFYCCWLTDFKVNLERQQAQNNQDNTEGGQQTQRTDSTTLKLIVKLQ